MKDVANISSELKRNSIPIAPSIIPKGTTGINKGSISTIPLKNNFIFLLIRNVN